ncbi:type II secretion system F family protein [Herbaspirillum sp. alder98]|uniref:type II secretion system F family protein n=1 Tax=Herbaspirillum sp. alder98 TaxID=2913096 RepID=UPI001CD8374B|nr:type II secretion system F family protein [Herbaspirillum sp. alder98]MCA1325642.1 type II secretion system F family protein [Herbaspirillum sp. alder98]
MLPDINRLWAKTQFTDTARLRLYRKMSKMLSNGLPLLKVLEELRDRESNNGKNPKEPLAIILDDCRRSVQNGRLLSEALDGWVPKSEQMILMAGEQSGKLEPTLISVVNVVQARKKINAVIVGGMAYPLAILGLVLSYIYLFGAKVIPQFTTMMDPNKWQGAARSLYLMSLWVQHWMGWTLLGIAVALVILFVSMPRWRGSLRIWADRAPPYSIYRLMVGSGFLLAFSALQGAGVTVEKALMRLSGGAQPWLRERLDGALLGVRSGLNCGEALRNTGYQFPSKEVIDDLCVYAEYKGFADALQLLADEWMEQGVEVISLRMKLVNGMAVVTMAIVIGWLVIGFFGIQQEIAALARAH